MTRPVKRVRSLLGAVVLSALVPLAAAPVAAASAITPPTPESPNASDLESAYIVALVVFIVLVVVVNAALIGAAMRRRTARGGGARLRATGGGSQLRNGTVLAVLAGALFTVGVIFAESAAEVEPSETELAPLEEPIAQVGIAPPVEGSEPLTIGVSGQQWLWRYTYPDGTFSYYEMVVPVDTTVVLELNSTDVLHRWWVPALGGKFDVEPGQPNRTWFKAEEEGTFDGQSAAFSGPGYATMRARVTAVSQGEYESWLSQQAADIQEAQETVRERVETGTVPGLESTE